MTLLTILGGVSLVLLGVEFIRRGVDRVFGHGLHAWIERMSRQTWSTVASGGVFGVLAPSSTAQTVLATQLVNSGKLLPERMLVFLLAANAGMTLKLFLLAFHFNRYYPAFLILGVFLYIYRRTEAARGMGLAILGLAMIFLSMELITGAVGVMTSDHDFRTILGVVTNHPWWLFCFTALLTLVMQSSTATVGLIMAVAEGSGTNGALVVPSVLGANLGIGLTCLMVGWPTLEGRRLGTAALTLRALIAMTTMVALGGLLGLLTAHPMAPAKEAALLHALFNLVALTASVLLGGAVGRLVRRTVPEEQPAPAGVLATHLDPAMLANPTFALNNAARETLRMLETVKLMLNDAWSGYERRDAALIKEVQSKDTAVDHFNASIRNYLSRISPDNMTPRDSQIQFGLLHFVSQLEEAADVIDRLLCRQILKNIETPRVLHPEDVNDLVVMREKVMKRFDLAIMIFTTRDPSYAEAFLAEARLIEGWTIEAERRHYARVVATADLAGIKASTHFLDMLNALGRISGQLNTLDHAFGLTRERGGSVAAAA